jgi:hypothetical protein
MQLSHSAVVLAFNYLLTRPLYISHLFLLVFSIDGHASLKSDQQAVLADAYAKLQKRVHNGV